MSDTLVLPRLTSAELLQLFGDDVAALQRYRMLAALLSEGRPIGEVARTYGVSRESLRRLRQAYALGNLAALQTRKRGGGHFARGSLLVQIMRDELQNDPGISAGVLWRHVSIRLEQQGVQAPRSTFYRLLARLRSEEENPTDGRASVAMLREALSALQEDPPIALGRSQLAELLLPDERDAMRRGQHMAMALRNAIERMRPNEAGPLLDDPRWRQYMIIAGEYMADTDRNELQTTLALSASTYTRAKREALEFLRALLATAIAELPRPVSTVTLAAPPAVRLDEREQELEQYVSVLRRRGIALIWSQDDEQEPAELAAALAGRLKTRGQHVIWHVCRASAEDERHGLQLLQVLIAALALVGRRELWDMVTDERYNTYEQQMALLASSLSNLHWTIFIAESQLLSDELALKIIDVLNEARKRGDIRFVLAGKSLPAWAEKERWPPLPALNDALGRRLFRLQLSRAGPAPATLDLPVLPAIRDSALELIALLPQRTTLTAEQTELVLSALKPIELLIERLRTAHTDEE